MTPLHRLSPESPAFPVTDGGGSGFPTTTILVLVLVLAGVAAVSVGRQWVGGATGAPQAFNVSLRLDRN